MQEAALKFIALRDALRAQCPKEFTHAVNTEVCGRTLALRSAARIDTQAKILGMIATKNTIYSTEQRMYALEPNPLTAEAVDGWWAYGRRLVDELIVPEAGHQFSMVSLIIACPQVDPRVGRSLRRLKYEPHYEKGKLGWCSLRFAVIDLSDGRVYTNSMGAPLANILKSAWDA